MIRHEQGSPLLRPVAVGDLRLPNRVVMAPATRARAGNSDLAPTDLHAAYYAQRATAGLIIAEGAWVSEGAIGFPSVPGIYSSRQVAAWSRVTDVVHALGGRSVLQLWHAGANSHPDHLGGALPLGPSAINPGEISRTPAGPKETVTPREMNAGDIARTVEEYGAASSCARRAGFDGVEIAANGTYLIAQFLNPVLNRRTDAYGSHRARLLLEIVDAVTAAWDGRNVGVRLSPFVLIANNGFGREAGEAIISSGIADAVSFARLFIANPDLVSRFALGHGLTADDRTTHYSVGART